ncbi:hypothetical protein H1C71_001415, partial [Ictidomys tridecemlineatus]
GHIRAHTGLPGALNLGNELADKSTHDIHIFSTIEEAINFHKRFHVNANTLQKYFKITKEQARQIIKQCQNCVTFLPQVNLGVNPRGLIPNHIWQMDVTHLPEFGKLKYLHVTVDTSSGF